MEREEAIKILMGYSHTPEERAALEVLIPELAESEDERVRKWILEKVQGYADSGIPCPGDIQMANKALTYLEKQKESLHIQETCKGNSDSFTSEQKVPEQCLKCNEYEIGYKAGYTHGCTAGYNKAMKEVDEHPKEQKPAEKQDYTGLTDLERAIHRGFLSAGVESVPVTIIKETAQDCLAQIKPAEWDEYTKTNLYRALQIIKKAKGTLQGYQSDDGIYECDKAIECLEHFLYRGFEIEKPAEWSEEDENAFKYLHELISWGYAEKFMDAQTAHDMRKWVNEHLRPSWKPSEEQMNRLSSIIAALRKDYCDDMADFLASIYHNLKKLI